ncbi:EamA family transporter [Roseateles chitosanitabidus]|uniref:EamA family transporter n=1 Tax=Roseateles chitosanitabidus TaxID=65048 RepID=UPI000834B741|nr:EamA family transporter [Roseateles chitosanitabidus]MBO9687723.1 EamA family transporter [Roseateles chitosanitabidus]
MTLPLRHFLLALSVVAIWGSNFVVIRWGLNAFPPLLFAALRFTFAAIPAIFLLPKPKIGWRNLAAYGGFVGVGQFGLLYLAMRSEISPGLASLVIQTQVFFTLLLAMRMSGERVQGFQWLALAMAAGGIGIIASHTDGSTTVLGLAMVLVAAFSWSSGNIVGKRAGAVNMLAYVVWSSVFAAPPLFALSLIVEGPQQMGEALRHAGLGAWAAVLWQSVGNTIFGYGAWSWLLSRHPAATIVPMALLVPVFGMSCSALLLGEGLPGWKLMAAALVMSGLAVNLLWPRVRGVLRAA